MDRSSITGSFCRSNVRTNEINEQHREATCCQIRQRHSLQFTKVGVDGGFQKTHPLFLDLIQTDPIHTPLPLQQYSGSSYPRRKYGGSFRLCGLVVRVPGYRSRGNGFDSRRYQIFSEKWWVWNGVHLASWVQLRSYLEEIVAAVARSV
jgi:hypothetical protein